MAYAICYTCDKPIDLLHEPYFRRQGVNGSSHDDFYWHNDPKSYDKNCYQDHLIVERFKTITKLL